MLASSEKRVITVDDLAKIVTPFGNSNSLLNLRFVTMCLLVFLDF